MDPQCFCCTTLRDVIFTEWCSVDVMSTTIVYYTCSGMLGHRSWYQSICFDLRIKTLLGRSVGWIVTIGAILSKPRLVMDIHLSVVGLMTSTP